MLADGAVVGRIMKAAAAPVRMSWMWTLIWVVGRNAQIDIRWGMGDPERIRKNVTELVALTPVAIFATTFPIVVALQQATRTVPIVFAGLFDPVGVAPTSTKGRLEMTFQKLGMPSRVR